MQSEVSLTHESSFCLNVLDGAQAIDFIELHLVLGIFLEVKLNLYSLNELIVTVLARNGFCNANLLLLGLEHYFP